jgi:6-phosphogluconolactonase/glucosamine-6-phosphate isomerase/deaminase
LASVLDEHLDKKERVLWLVPGGSSIVIAAAVCKALSDKPLENLYVTLTDERYGPVGHADSNWRQLAEAGFDLSFPHAAPVLTGTDRAATTAAYAKTLQQFFDETDYKLGFFGIGPDGHTAGMLPGSLAVSATELTASYDAGNFERITITTPAVARLDEAVVYATGEAKWPVLDQLQQERPLAEQPAQALKQVPKLTIFNDHIGDAV